MKEELEKAIQSLVNKTSPVLEEDLDYLYEMLEYIPMRRKDRDELQPLIDMIDSIDTEHIKTRNLCKYRMKRLMEHYVEDLTSKYLSKRERQAINHTLSIILKYKKVTTTNLKLDKVKEILGLIEDISLTELDNYLDNRDNKEKIGGIIDSININLYNYNYSEGDSVAPRALGGGGSAHFLSLDDNDYQQTCKLLIKLKSSSRVICEAHSNISVYTNKLASLITHIHLSRGSDIPIPRYFLEDNGYECLTSNKMIDLDTGEVFKSLDIIQGLGLGFVSSYNVDKRRAREVSLTQLGMVVACTATLCDKRVVLKELELQPGDLCTTRKDYSYYLEQDIIPDVPLIDEFLEAIESTTVNITGYLEKFRAQYPIVAFSLEEYYEYVTDNIKDIQDGIDQNIPILSNFSRDFRSLTTGFRISKKYSKALGKRDIILSFTNVWKLSYTGRLFQRFGLQGITRQSKRIVHENNVNYDIPTSQLRVLKQILEDIQYMLSEDDESSYKVHIGWLDRYIADKSFRESLRASTGLPDEEWKKAMYSIVFGSNLNSAYENSAINTITLKNSIFNPDFNRTKFYQSLHSLDTLVGIWLKYIPQYKENYKLSPLMESRFENLIQAMEMENLDPANYIFNGVSFIHKECSSIRHKKHFSAYMLQGIESAFILHLALLNTKGVVSQEFDGVISNNQIHPEIIEEARRRSGFRLGEVIVKDFTIAT